MDDSEDEPRQLPAHIQDALLSLPGEKEGALWSVSQIVATWKGRLKATTRAAYKKDLDVFVAWAFEVEELIDVENHAIALEKLLLTSGGLAKSTMVRYQSWLVANYAPSTANRRISTLRSFFGLAKDIRETEQGVRIDWDLDRAVNDVPVEKYRDTRGPGLEGAREILKEAQVHPVSGKRDYAITRLLFDQGLRRSEVCNLDFSSVDLERDKLKILGKGRLQEETVDLNEESSDALFAWIVQRGDAPGPLFIRLDSGGKNLGLRRLTPDGLYKMIRKISEAAGCKTRPHGLRHAAISALLDQNNGNVREAAKFSRHRDVKTLMIYDDARGELQKKASDALGKLTRVEASDDDDERNA